MTPEDDSSVSEITILPDGRICVFGASRQILEMLNTVPWDNSDLAVRVDCFCSDDHQEETSASQLASNAEVTDATGIS